MVNREARVAPRLAGVEQPNEDEPWPMQAAVKRIASGLFAVPAHHVEVVAAPVAEQERSGDGGPSTAQAPGRYGFEVLRSGQTVVVHDADTPGDEARWSQADGGAYVAVPVQGPDEVVVGALGVSALGPVPISGERVEALESLGSLVGFTAHLTATVTAQRSQIEALEARVAAVEAEANARRRLATELVHDMRNSVTAVEYVVQGLRLRRQDSAEQQMLATATRALTGLASLVDDLMMLALLRDRSYTPFAEAIELARELEICAAAFGAAASHPIEIRCDPGMILRSDRRLVHRIIGNLVANAVRHADAGGPIWIEVALTPQQWHVRVCDQGPGIPPELVDRLFDRFLNVRHNKGVGLGFGLPFARMAARLLGGNLYAVTVPRGACFELVLPLEPPEGLAEGDPT